MLLVGGPGAESKKPFGVRSVLDKVPVPVRRTIGPPCSAAFSQGVFCLVYSLASALAGGRIARLDSKALGAPRLHQVIDQALPFFFR